MGKGGSDVEYTQSPEQRQMYALLNPMIQKMSGAALGYTPSTGGGGFSGKFGKGGGGTGQGSPTGPLYDIPSAEGLMPSQGWYDSLSPEVMQGVWEPYNEGAKQMMETMGGQGQLGSARGGYTGAGADAMGRYYADAATGVGQQAWGMTSPGLNQAWQAELQREQMPWGMLPGLLGGTYSQPVVTQNSNLGGDLLGTAATAAMLYFLS